MKKTTLIASLAMLIGLSTSAMATTVTVSAMADIFGAAGLPSGSYDGSGNAPTEVNVTGGSQLNILSTGTVNCSSAGGFCGSGGTSDGSQGTGAVVFSGDITPVQANQTSGTAINAPGNGISGITFTGRDMFLVGVFINTSALPTVGTTPGTPNYGTSGALTPVGNGGDATDVPTYQPVVNQVFFVGDGMEGYNGVCPGAVVDGVGCTNGQVQIFCPDWGHRALSGLR